MNPVIISLGILEIRWYSILILIAFTLGYFIVINKCKKEKMDLTIISDLCFYIIIFCILGARLYYCIFNFSYYSKNILDVFKIWEGGLAIHGGIISGILTTYFYTKKKKLPFLKIVDIFIPALVLGQAIGRWGNFFNMEAYGPEITLIQLQKMGIPNFIIDGMYINHSYHHPTFLYESLGCLIIFIIILLIRNLKTVKFGFTTGIYFILYGIIRLFIESLRQDSLMLFNIKVAQLMSIIMIIIGIYLVIGNQKFKKNS